jgi:hypothetical protein
VDGSTLTHCRNVRNVARDVTFDTTQEARAHDDVGATDVSAPQ